MPFDKKLLPKWLFNIIFYSGHYAVILFFVISGYLITHISIKRWAELNSISYKFFYYLRFARIFPCLIGLLTILVILDYLNITGFVIHKTSIWQAVLAALTFRLNYLESQIGWLPGNWDVLWTLSVEEMFYLFFPIICLVTRNKLFLVMMMCVFIIIGPFSRVYSAGLAEWDGHAYLSCMDGIAIGCLAALFAQYKSNVLIKYKRIVFSLGLILFMLVSIFRHQVYQLGLTSLGLNITIFEFSSALLILTISKYDSKWSYILRWFGKHSYEIYLTHMFFVTSFSLLIFDASTSQSNIYIIFLYFSVLLLSGCLGQLIAQFFSEPVNQWLRSYYSNKSSTISS